MIKSMIKNRPNQAGRVVNDMSDESEEEEAAEPEEIDLSLIELRKTFGHHAPRVQLILRMWQAYGLLFNAHWDDWRDDTDTEERAVRAVEQAKAAHLFRQLLEDVSNGRTKDKYGGRFAYLSAEQTMREGDTRKFSTRATEARGARINKIKRRITCLRKKAISKGKRAFKYKGGGWCWREQGYSSCGPQQLMRVQCMQEESFHKKPGSLLSLQGRRSLVRQAPKWAEVSGAPLPPKAASEAIGPELFSKALALVPGP